MYCNSFKVTPRKLAWQWNIHHWKMYFPLTLGFSNAILVFRGVMVCHGGTFLTFFCCAEMLLCSEGLKWFVMVYLHWGLHLFLLSSYTFELQIGMMEVHISRTSPQNKGQQSSSMHFQLHHFYIWGFPKMVVPQNGWFIMENPRKNGWFGGTTI